MPNLTKQLQDLGLSHYESEASLFLIEDWLRDHYPVLAQLYQVEILRKELAPPQAQVKLIPIERKVPLVIMNEVNKWKKLA